MRESVINLAADARPIYGPYTGRRKPLRSRGPAGRSWMLPAAGGAAHGRVDVVVHPGGDSRLNRVRKQVAASYHFDGIVYPCIRCVHVPTLGKTFMPQLSIIVHLLLATRFPYFSLESFVLHPTGCMAMNIRPI